jgi:hypothetical protein
MTEHRTAIPLTASERELIYGLRAIPESALKRRIVTLVDDIVRLGQEPSCAEAQADGVPCACSDSNCETCIGVFNRLSEIVDQASPIQIA